MPYRLLLAVVGVLVLGAGASAARADVYGDPGLAVWSSPAYGGYGETWTDLQAEGICPPDTSEPEFILITIDEHRPDGDQIRSILIPIAAACPPAGQRLSIGAARQ